MIKNNTQFTKLSKIYPYYYTVLKLVSMWSYSFKKCVHIVKHMSTCMHIHAYIDVHKCVHLLHAFSKLLSLEKTEFSCLVIKMKALFIHTYKMFKSTNLRDLI